MHTLQEKRWSLIKQEQTPPASETFKLQSVRLSMVEHGFSNCIHHHLNFIVAMQVLSFAWEIAAWGPKC